MKFFSCLVGHTTHLNVDSFSVFDRVENMGSMYLALGTCSGGIGDTARLDLDVHLEKT